MKQLPFHIIKAPDVSLTDQVINGIRTAVSSGYYRTSDPLPTLIEMAKILGVSEIVTRRAVQRLVREGVLSARPRSGIRVCATGSHHWRAQILHLHWYKGGSYYQGVLNDALTEALIREDLLATAVLLSVNERRRNYPQLVTALRCAPISLAIVNGISLAGLEQIFSEHCVPFVHVTARPPPSTAILKIDLCLDHARRELAMHAKKKGIKSAGIFVCRQSSSAMRRAFNEYGIRSDVFVVPPIPGIPTPECVERGGFDYMAAIIAQRLKLPDLLYFEDDYLTKGALLAITAAGLHVPEDFRISTIANHGMGPVFSRPLTRIEINPIEHAKIIARCITQIFGGRKNTTGNLLTARFIAGASI